MKLHKMTLIIWKTWNDLNNMNDLSDINDMKWHEMLWNDMHEMIWNDKNHLNNMKWIEWRQMT
jgi:hypothetical protein